MFMSFGNAPRIMRFFCNSSVVEWDHPEFPELVRRIAKGKREAFDGARAVILCDIWQVQTSCGYAVPRVKKGIYAPDEEEPLAVEDVLRQGKNVDDDRLDELAVFETRETLDNSLTGKVQANKIFEYHRLNNAYSLDGLPGLLTARRDAGHPKILVDLRAWARRVAAEKHTLALGFGMAVFLYAILASLGVL